MNVCEKYLIEAMVCGCKGIPTPPPSEKIDLEYFFKKAKEHKIENIILKGVCDNIDMFENTEKIIPLWKHMSIMSSVSLIQLDAIVKKIMDKFEEEKKSLILLKGSVLKDLYPKKEMRTMGDTDIIIKKEEHEEAKKIFESFGYAEVPDKDGNPQYRKENNYKFEAFFELTTIDNLWEKVDNIKGKSFLYRLNNEMFLFHLVSHLAKHLRYSGAGIRNLCDIYLIMENWDIDYNKVKEELEKRGLVPLFDAFVKILEMYFGFRNEKISSKASRETAEKLMNFMVRYGVYGTKSENNIFVRGQKYKVLSKKDRILENIRMFFPKSEKLSDKYGYAKKRRVLLPFAWLHRLFDKRFIEKRTMSDTLKEISDSNTIMDYQVEIINEFKL